MVVDTHVQLKTCPNQSTSLHLKYELDVFNGLKMCHALLILALNCTLILILVVFRRYALKNRSRDTFTLALAGADFFVGAQSIFNSILYYHNVIDYCRNAALGGMNFATAKLGVYASLLTFVAFALVQLWTVRHPFAAKFTTKQCIGAILGVWTLSLAFVAVGKRFGKVRNIATS